MFTKYWTLTLNNYTDEEVELFDNAVSKGHCVYVCYQKEVGVQGTPHLQGYAVFKVRKRLPAIKKTFGPRIHGVLSNGSPSANRAYCCKSDTAVPGSFKEYGEIPSDATPGKRSDLDAFVEAVKGGLRCKRKAREEFKEVVAKYPRWCYDILADQTEISVEDHPLLPWQIELNSMLAEEPNDRQVLFVVDHEGNKGKTWFAKHYCKNHVNAQYLEPSKKADMAYALQDNLRVLFLNISRTSDSKNQEYLYSFIESVKDGMVFSPKYESRMKYFSNVHVVVMMNTDPDVNLLSKDRYAYLYL